MDKYSISGTDLRLHYDQQTKLSEVFGDIEHDLIVQKRVVCRYIVNGIELSEEDEYRFSKAQLSEIESLEFLADDLGSLLGDVLVAWQAALPELILKTEQLCENIRSEGGLQKMTRFHNLFENCEYLVSSLESLSAMDANDKIQSDPAWKNTGVQMKKALTESLGAFEKKDFSNLANILDYELIPCLESWVMHLASLKDSFVENRDKIAQRYQSAESDSKYFVGWKVRSN